MTEPTTIEPSMIEPSTRRQTTQVNPSNADRRSIFIGTSGTSIDHDYAPQINGERDASKVLQVMIGPARENMIEKMRPGKCARADFADLGASVEGAGD
jgi:hypothetical protein